VALSLEEPPAALKLRLDPELLMMVYVDIDVAAA